MSNIVDWSLDYAQLRRSLLTLSKPKLVKACKYQKVGTNGSKQEMVQRILNKLHPSNDENTYSQKRKRSRTRPHRKKPLQKRYENTITYTAAEDTNKKEEQPPDTTYPHHKRQPDNLIQDIKHKLHNADHEIRDQKYSPGECLCFFTFLIVFTVMSILSKGNGDVSFTQSASIRKSLIQKDEFKPWNEIGEKTFIEASTIMDIYAYLNDVALPFLLGNHNTYMPQLILLGGLRLKQLRLNESECANEQFPVCYSDEFNSNTVSYYYPNDRHAEDFMYMSSEELLDQSWRGKYGTYDGGGYIFDLSLSYSLAVQQVEYLHNISWLDGGTRFVALDLNAFNPSTSLHTVCRLAWEMSTAGVFPNDEIKTWKFDRYTGTDGSVLFVFYILFLLWVIGMTVMTLASCWNLGCTRCGKGKSYWNSKWKALDAVNLIVFYVSISLFISNEYYRSYGMDMYDTFTFVSFRQLQWGFTMESYSIALNGALLWIGLFKYLAINKRLRFLFTMLGHSSMDILMFVIVLSVFVIAFATAGFVSFSSDVDDFRSYVFSMSNMIRFVLVEMDYQSLILSSRFWGSAFYFIWSLLMLLILSNVFIAILVDGYAKVKEDLTDDDAIDFGMKRMSAHASGIWTRIRSLTASATHDDLDEDQDGKISAKELANQSNISIQRAQDIIDQYDVDNDGQLDRHEFEKLKQQIADDHDKRRSSRSERLSSRNRKRHRARGTSEDEQEKITNMIKMTKEFYEMKQEVRSFKQLLAAVLDQTPAGKRVLKRMNADI
eukprot:361108_1